MIASSTGDRAGERVTGREQAAGVLGDLRDAFRHHALLAGPIGQPRHVAERGEGDAGIDAGMEAVRRQAGEMAADRRRSSIRSMAVSTKTRLPVLVLAGTSVSLHQTAQHVAVE